MIAIINCLDFLGYSVDDKTRDEISISSHISEYIAERTGADVTGYGYDVLNKGILLKISTDNIEGKHKIRKLNRKISELTEELSDSFIYYSFKGKYILTWQYVGKGAYVFRLREASIENQSDYKR